jgi:hypothetical protein
LTKYAAPPAEDHAELVNELMRLDPRTGRVLAIRSLGSAFDQALLAEGSLWVTTTGRQGTLLWRLDPHTLGVRSRILLPSIRHGGLAGSLVVAAGQLWVGTGTLDRVSLTSVRVDRVVKLPYRGTVQLAADPTGRVLLAALGYEHPTYIARLNPRTGALQARITAPWSVTQPSIKGVVDGGAWIYNSSGMAGGSWRIAVNTLRPTRTQALPIPAQQSSAQLINGILWVTEPFGANTLTYCADPVTGRVRARLPLLVGNSKFLTANATSIYYLDEPLQSSSATLERAPLDRRCTT